MSPPIRVLLVEDDEEDFLLTRDLLSEIATESFALDWVATYEAAREAMERQEHQIYLLDFRLGARNGLELLREGVEQGCQAPMIFLTGQRDPALALEAIQSGASDYLVKGQIHADLLHRSIRYAMERKRAEEERIHLLAREQAAMARADALAEADRRKDEFLAMLGHELRNPLGVLSNALRLLRLAPADGPVRQQALEVAERQVAHQTRLVDDLLDVSRITLGKIPLQREWLDLAWLVRHAVEDHRAALEAAGLAVHLELPAEPLWVAGDRTRLLQVVGNLLSNALKFTERGGQVAVQVRTAADRPPTAPVESEGSSRLASRGDACVAPTDLPHIDAVGGRRSAVLTVRDTGVGIDPSMLPRIFESFVQADRSLDRSRGGLGLGLALVKGLAELHGGQVRVESAGLGRGATFTVRLPLAADGGPHVEQDGPPAAQSTPRRILVIEDNQDAAETLRDILELVGHTVEIAFSGQAGVEAARRIHPEVVLCDIGLPGMDGYAVARALRQDPATAAIHLVALSGYGQDEDRRQTREAGFDEHLTKPVNFAELEAVLAASPGRS
jgi:signal transduction histidine kinase